MLCRVEAPITNHVRDFEPYLEKFKAVQMILRKIWEDGNKAECNFLILLFIRLKLL